MLPPLARLDNAVDTIPVKHLHSSLNKIKHPINVVKWTPEGRRLLTGSTSGEFTLWNGMGFNFETIMQVCYTVLVDCCRESNRYHHHQAHDCAIRAAIWSHSDDWLISADQEGIIKYWQPNFNNVKAFQAHSEPVRDIAFAPTDVKFVTGSDDANLKIFDFAGGVEESVLTGHNWEVKCVDWHPSKGLLVSGSKDHQVKLWDPRNGRCLTTLHGHKNTIARTMFEPTQGQMLATCARDQIARVFDLRMMRDVLLLRGHEKDITTLTWHPVHRNLLSTGGVDGSLFHYLLDEPNLPSSDSSLASISISPYDSPDPANAPAQTIYPAHKLPYAHDFAVWALDWHPLGHILASGSNDRVTRFWSRPRPGDTACFNDRYHIGQAAAEAQGTYDRRDGRRQMREQEEQEAQDEAEGLVDQQMPSKQGGSSGLPGLLPGINSGLAPPPQLPGIGAADPPMAGINAQQNPNHNPRYNPQGNPNFQPILNPHNFSFLQPHQQPANTNASHSTTAPASTNGMPAPMNMPILPPNPNMNFPLAAWPGLEKGQIPDISRLAELYGGGSGGGGGDGRGPATPANNTKVPHPSQFAPPHSLPLPPPPPHNLPFSIPPVPPVPQGYQK